MINRAHEIFESILQKPESTRKKIAFVLVVLMSTIIVSIWWSTFSLEPTDVAAQTNTSATVASPLAITWNSLKNTLQSNPIFK